MSTPGVCGRNTESSTGTDAVTQVGWSGSGWISVTMCDGRDDVFDRGGGLKMTVTIDTDRHVRGGSRGGTPLPTDIFVAKLKVS